jgi:hypothetical protein
MDWVCRLGRIGGFVGVAGTAACGKSYRPAPPPGPVPAGQSAACAPVTAPAGPISVAFAGPPDSVGASDPAAAVAALLTQIAAAAIAPACVNPRPARPIDTTEDGQDTVVVRQVGERGARDALDQGADIVVTRDRSVVAYAADNAGLVSVPLPWDRVYVLVVRPGPAWRDSVADSLREALASDAVHADARAFGAGRVSPGTVCSGDSAHPASAAVAPPPAARRTPGAARILYDQADSVSRFLAERMAVLASTSSSLLAGMAPALGRMDTEMYATGLPAGELPGAVTDGSGGAYIIAIPSATLQLCGEAGALPAIVPLIQTRAWAIVRRDGVSRIAALGGRPVVAEVRAP